MTGAGQRLTSKQSCENVACDKTGSQSDWCQTDEKKIPVHCCGCLHACIIYIKWWSGERLLQCARPQFLHSTAVLNIRSSTLAWLSVYVLTLFLSSSFFLCVCVSFLVFLLAIVWTTNRLGCFQTWHSVITLHVTFHKMVLMWKILTDEQPVSLWCGKAQSCMRCSFYLLIPFSQCVKHLWRVSLVN